MGLPDIVYVVRNGEANEELRYSLRSLCANVPHARVWIAGYKPSWVSATVAHIPVAQSAGTKYQNSSANLAAAARHPEVADEFLLFNDDFFAMQPVESRVPVYHRGTVAAVESYYRRRYARRGGRYLQGMVATRKLLASKGITAPWSYEVHVPMPLEKTKVLEVLALGRSIVALHKRTLYGNLYGLGGTQLRDPKILTYSAGFPRNGAWLSTSEATFGRGQVGAFIRKAFPSPCPYEGRISHRAPSGVGRKVVARWRP